VVKKQKLLNRSLSRKPFFPLFSTEPASQGSPPVTPGANYINGAASSQASFEESKSGVVDGGTASGNKGLFSTSLLGKFRQVSNFASFLCVLDCTLLPLVTVALPLLGVLNLGASQLHALNELGHSLALFFVLPVGTLTTVVNYLSHKKKKIAALAVLGMTMVGLANSHIHVHHWPSLGPISLDWMGGVLHNIQDCCGASIWHRITNVGGCAFLLGSNFWSQKQDGCAAHNVAGSGDCCGHDHNH
jgi:hypothetical protein